MFNGFLYALLKDSHPFLLPQTINARLKNNSSPSSPAMHALPSYRCSISPSKSLHIKILLSCLLPPEIVLSILCLASITALRLFALASSFLPQTSNPDPINDLPVCPTHPPPHLFPIRYLWCWRPPSALCWILHEVLPRKTTKRICILSC